MRNRYRQIGRPVASYDRWWLVLLTHRVGASAASKRIGTTRGTLAAVLAGLPVAASTDQRVRAARLRSERKAA